MTERSNANLIQNADYLLASFKQVENKIAQVGQKQRYDAKQFKLTY